MKRGRPPQRRSAVRLITGGELPVRRNYEAIVFEHDADVITVLFERLAADRGLVGLREAPAFEAAVAAVGPVAARTDSRYVRALSRPRAVDPADAGPAGRGLAAGDDPGA